MSLGVCQQCLESEERRDRPGIVAAAPGLPGVVQCTRCSYRVAYGERAPRVCVQPDGAWRVVTVEPADGSEPFELRVDAGLAHLIARNLLSLG